MKAFFRSLCLLLACSSLLEASKIPDENLYAHDYLVCLEGGGSRTSLQVLDKKGHLVPLAIDSHATCDLVQAGGSNINLVGQEGFRGVLDALFDPLFIGQDLIPFKEIQARCMVIGGFAGLVNNQAQAQAAFEAKGFQTNQLLLMSDADLSLELAKDRGVILIAGTGSICLGLEKGATLRAGGFGKLLNDDSGYHVGICAIRAALEQEFGYGPATALTEVVKKQFQVQSARELITKVHSGELTTGQIAAVAKEVFELALQGDKLAEEIAQNSSVYLGELLWHVVRRMDASKPIDVYLIGGLFKTSYPLSDKLLETRQLQAWLGTGSLRLHNMSAHPIATYVVQKRLLEKKT